MTRLLSLSLTILGLLVLSFSSRVNAAFITLENKLAYDDSLNRVWYTGFDLYGSFHNLNPMLALLPKTTKINSQRVQLDWGLATIAEINTITFLNESTFSAFYGGNASTFVGHHIFSGLTGDVMESYYWGDYEGGPGLVESTLVVNRGVIRDESGLLHWYNDHAPWYDSFTGDVRDPTMPGPSDSRIPLEVLGDSRFWLVADLRIVNIVSEPPVMFLLLAAFFGLAVSRRTKRQ